LDVIVSVGKVKMMGTEVELKLAVPSSVLRQAIHARWLKKRAVEQANRQQLTSIYFDTPDFALRNHGVTLRVRKSDTTTLQTIKATRTDIIQRDEWEDEIDGDRPKLSLAGTRHWHHFCPTTSGRNYGPSSEPVSNAW
jgi:triphosphatase